MHQNDPELEYWLSLAHTPGIGIKTIQKLLLAFSSVKNIFHAKTEKLRQHQLTETQITHLKNPDPTLFAITEKWFNESAQNHIIVLTDKHYPKLLLEIAGTPPILYATGDIQLLSLPQIAMVGSRNPSKTGIEIAHQFACELARTGMVVTSGLAMGIDAASHEGALKAPGKTIAVLGSGLHHIYPKKHVTLAKSIMENGCVISEYPLTTPPRAENFPRRNRVISGLSLGTLVVEAALQSGSLITARHAMEQNREVFALPGSIRNPMSTGCLALIQQGAKCVTCVQDVLDEMVSHLPHDFSSHSPKIALNSSSFNSGSLDPEHRRVLACIDNEVTTVDQICARSRLSAQWVTSILLILELNGHIYSKWDGYYKA